MSVDRLRWAEKAQELRFTQLDVVRRQAESWRTGLTGITALLSAVLIIRGRSDLADLVVHYKVALLSLFGVALGALVAATLLAVRAASGAPGDEVLLVSEDLERWTKSEVRAAQQAIGRARLLTVVGVVAVAVGSSVLGVAPTRPTEPEVATVHTPNGDHCGRVGQFAPGILKISGKTGYALVPLDAVVRVEPVAVCP
ncbi:hypothetical protein AB0K04_14735 [Micromonospora coxensis]|uniref:hypothetical protein n=1 Tax=Micromonospora coxensis TaxID=356852 RepID=UPI003438FA38